MRPEAALKLIPFESPALIARHSETKMDISPTNLATQVIFLEYHQKVQADRNDQKYSEAP